jgi:hypothetical protein
VHEIRLELTCDAIECEGIAEEVTLRSNILSRPGERLIGGARRTVFGDESDRVSAFSILADERIDDPLNSAIAHGRHKQHGIGGEKYFHPAKNPSC